MYRFARVIDLPEVNSQILLTVDYVDEDNAYKLSYRVEAKGMTVTAGSIYPSEVEPEEVSSHMMELSHQEAMEKYHALVKVIAGEAT